MAKCRSCGKWSGAKAVAQCDNCSAGVAPPVPLGEYIPDDYGDGSPFTGGPISMEENAERIEDMHEAMMDFFDLPRPTSTPEHDAYLKQCRAEGKDLTFIQTPQCGMCEKGGTIAVATEDLEVGDARRAAGALIQDSYPTLSAPIREQIKTGTHPACFDRMVGFFE